MSRDLRPDPNGRPTPTLPSDDYDREWLQRRAIVENRLFVLLRVWFALQLASAVIVMVGPILFMPGGSRFWPFLFLAGVWLLTFVPMVTAAWLTLTNWPVLRRRWRFFGLAPWGVLATEGALILSGLA